MNENVRSQGEQIKRISHNISKFDIDVDQPTPVGITCLMSHRAGEQHIIILTTHKTNRVSNRQLVQFDSTQHNPSPTTRAQRQ
jgi:hypothetical protein